MRFVDLNGVLGKARRAFSGSDNLSESDVQDPRKLAELLRAAMRRIAALEANAQPDAVEFEIDATMGSTSLLQHGFGCPVRYWVVSWVGSGGPQFYVNTSQTTSDVLALSTAVSGRAIVRVEASQFTPRYT